jgi:hypothetical protein
MKVAEIIVEASPSGTNPPYGSDEWNKSRDYILKVMKKISPTFYKDAESYKQAVSRLLVPTLGNNISGDWVAKNLNVDDSDLEVKSKLSRLNPFGTDKLGKKLTSFANATTVEWYNNRASAAGAKTSSTGGGGSGGSSSGTANNETIAKALSLIGVRISPSDPQLMKKFAVAMATNSENLAKAMKEVTGIA